MVLFATTQSTAPTKANGVTAFPKTFATTRTSRASAFGSVVESGGRKYSKPVEPPMLMPRCPASSNVQPRISRSDVPPLHWIALLPMVRKAQLVDATVVAADVVDAAAGADALEDAVAHDVVVDARQLQPVVVAARADVVHVQAAEDHVPGGLGVRRTHRRRRS